MVLQVVEFQTGEYKIRLIFMHLCNFSGFEIYDLSQVIELLKAEALSLKMVQEDRMNHNTISVSDHDQALTANLTDDISIPTEDCFTGRNTAGIKAQHCSCLRLLFRICLYFTFLFMFPQMPIVEIMIIKSPSSSN